MRLFVFGFGYSAAAVAARLRPNLTTAWGTTRDAGKLAEIKTAGVEALLFDAGQTGVGPRRQGGRGTVGAISAPIAKATHILVAIPPGEAGDPVLGHFRGELVAARLRSIVYLSTVGVYGDHCGAWVDETSACRPVAERSRRRLAAEAAWRRFSDAAGVPVAIVRLGGIYGAGRGPFEKVRSGAARRIVKPGQMFNRIHVEDVAQIVEAAFDRCAAGVFNAVDDEPAPPQDVLACAASLLGVPPPPEIDFEAADLSPMARSFYEENKRVRNDKIKRELGVRLSYPTYREGLAAVLAAERARAAAD
jgi:dTDP-4-dehydrorhamnose reductase